MIENLIISSLLVLSNIFIHAYGLSIISYLHRFVFHNSHSAFIIGLIVMGILFLHTVEIWIWAIYYLYTDIFNTTDPPLFTTTYTTVGFGDIIMSEITLIGAIESAVGIFVRLVGSIHIYALAKITHEK